MVLVQGLETLMPKILPHWGMDFAMLRFFRITRAVRILRAGRVVDAISELRIFVITMQGSLRSLMWIMAVLALTTYTFSIVLTQLVADYTRAGTKVNLKDGDVLEDMFGSVGATMLCLYQTFTGGLEWRKMGIALAEVISPWMTLIFCLYIGFTLFGLLNVMTGLFLNAAQRTAEEDKKRLMLDQMRRMFDQADADGSGEVSREEFEMHLHDEDFLLYLRAIDLHEDNARELFGLLDGDKSGQIDAEEFVHGCMRLQGALKAVDFAVYLSEHRVWQKEMTSQLEQLDRMCRRAVTGLPIDATSPIADS
eukprot:TRINITY_DN11507_c0_g2_i1.p1 TRINITY_DN11507_c0_g2~~TRINITY_DN11507_c0_g2_i1.p1  ORF type:complete len:349 (-),score=60.51 TRINITY_DN11507_c0_g2_i1:439-1362(-)